MFTSTKTWTLLVSGALEVFFSDLINLFEQFLSVTQRIEVVSLSLG